MEDEGMEYGGEIRYWIESQEFLCGVDPFVDMFM